MDQAENCEFRICSQCNAVTAHYVCRDPSVCRWVNGFKYALFLRAVCGTCLWDERLQRTCTELAQRATAITYGRRAGTPHGR